MKKDQVNGFYRSREADISNRDRDGVNTTHRAIEDRAEFNDRNSGLGAAHRKWIGRKWQHTWEGVRHTEKENLGRKSRMSGHEI